MKQSYDLSILFSKTIDLSINLFSFYRRLFSIIVLVKLKKKKKRFLDKNLIDNSYYYVCLIKGG